ncbi:MAG: ribosome rescue GTPase HflX [Gammaproteobacteria bacterium]
MPEQGVLVQVNFSSTHFENYSIEELELLIRSAGAVPVSTLIFNHPKPQARFFVGKGNVERIAADVQASQADFVVFNNELSPGQQRNLENELKCRVYDRTEIILDIFAQRARTYEGKLQVELAQLQRLSTRLIRGWTHLERQKGGIGLRGPGETQLETDRRLIRERIKTIKKRLEKVERQRQQGRSKRLKSHTPTIAFVGYTNVGKSSLFNLLSKGEAYVADQLFATLDPLMRRIHLDEWGAVVLADTVGFIRGLPHQLVEAFKATLEEMTQANLLLHVVDAHEDKRKLHMQKVDEVLAEMGAEQLPKLIVYNKIDLLGDAHAIPRIDRDQSGRPYRVWISVEKKQGMAELKEAIVDLLNWMSTDRINVYE